MVRWLPFVGSIFGMMLVCFYRVKGSRRIENGQLVRAVFDSLDRHRVNSGKMTGFNQRA